MAQCLLSVPATRPMTTRDHIENGTFELPLPRRHDENHPCLFAKGAAQAQARSDFEDPADRLTVCEVPSKSLFPGLANPD